MCPFLEVKSKWPPGGGSKVGKGRPLPPPSPGAQILSISCSSMENMAKSYVGAPTGSWHPLLGEILDPPLPPYCMFTFRSTVIG